MVQPELAVSKLIAAKGVAVVYLAGYLNGHATWMVDAAIHELAGQGCTTVVIDVTWVHPVSCRGVRSLLASIHSWQLHGLKPVLCGMRPSCRTIFDLLDRPRHLELMRDVEAVMAWLQRSGNPPPSNRADHVKWTSSRVGSL
jgi:anti-anti-sigma factor